MAAATAAGDVWFDGSTLLEQCALLMKADSGAGHYLLPFLSRRHPVSWRDAAVLNPSVAFMCALNCGNSFGVDAALALGRGRVGVNHAAGLALRRAAALGLADLLHRLCADPTARPNACNNEALVEAARLGQEECVAILLAHPAVDPCADDDAALRHAAGGGCPGIVAALVAKGAAVGAQALTAAGMSSHPPVARAVTAALPAAPGIPLTTTLLEVLAGPVSSGTHISCVQALLEVAGRGLAAARADTLILHGDLSAGLKRTIERVTRTRGRRRWQLGVIALASAEGVFGPSDVVQAVQASGRTWGVQVPGGSLLEVASDQGDEVVTQVTAAADAALLELQEEEQAALAAAKVASARAELPYEWQQPDGA